MKTLLLLSWLLLSGVAVAQTPAPVPHVSICLTYGLTSASNTNFFALTHPKQIFTQPRQPFMVTCLDSQGNLITMPWHCHNVIAWTTATFCCEDAGLYYSPDNCGYSDSVSMLNYYMGL